MKDGCWGGKVVAITGAASGIGAAIARELANQGAALLLLDRNDAQLKQVLADCRGQQRSFCMDITSPSDWERFTAWIAAAEARLDVMINAAGIMQPLDIESTTPELWQHIMAVNAGGTFLASKTAVALMKTKNKGAIVNVASITAERTAGWVTAYGASKAAAVSVTRSVAQHCAQNGYGIRCNAVLPGVVDTPMLTPLLDAAEDRNAAYAALVASNPMGRLVTSEEVAHAVIFLASDLASGINGVALPVDGGQLAG